jgi:DNA-binding NarL/FixJ family response regulator
MPKKNIILIDPQEIFLCGLIKILEEEGNLNILDYTNIYDKISVILNKNADYYLICPEFEEDKENSIIRMAIDKNINNTTIFMINELSNTHEFYIKNKIFRGFIHKKSAKSEFIGMIKNILQNNYYVDPKLANKLDQNYDSNDNYVDDIRKVYKLTCREYEIFYLLSNGLSNVEIADRLCISEKTVRNNLTAIYKKLNLNTKAEAILFFHKINKK